jgi:hypothetical protein
MASKVKVSIREDLISEGLDIPDVKKGRYYGSEDIKGAKLIKCSVDGIVKLELKSGKKATVYSIDLDYSK